MNWNIFKRKRPPADQVESSKEPVEVDFAEMIGILTTLSKSAQVTFLRTYVQTLSPNMCESLKKFVYQRQKELKPGYKSKQDGSTDELQDTRDRPKGTGGEPGTVGHSGSPDASKQNGIYPPYRYPYKRSSPSYAGRVAPGKGMPYNRPRTGNDRELPDSNSSRQDNAGGTGGAPAYQRERL